MTSSLLGTIDRTTGTVHLERVLPAAPHEVWEALTDPERLGAWLAPVRHGVPGPGATFVLAMNETEAATCTVTAWDPPHRLGIRWDYTGEGLSELALALSAEGGQTRLVLRHSRIPADPVQYGAGWHVHLDHLAAHLEGEEVTVAGCTDTVFQAAYRAVEPRYAAVATG